MKTLLYSCRKGIKTAEQVFSQTYTLYIRTHRYHPHHHHIINKTPHTHTCVYTLCNHWSGECVKWKLKISLWKYIDIPAHNPTNSTNTKPKKQKLKVKDRKTSVFFLSETSHFTSGLCKFFWDEQAKWWWWWLQLRPDQTKPTYSLLP